MALLTTAGALTGLRRRVVARVVLRYPEEALGALGWSLASSARLPDDTELPERLDRFEDVAPLVLSSNPANRGLASMRIDEAARLWSLAESIGEGTIVEVGRERGGSTLVLAAAMPFAAVLHSYDPQAKLAGADVDAPLRRVLERYGLGSRAHLHVEDSHAAAIPPGELALVLVDGDPTSEGARLDYERFCLRLRPGGLALFHDATPGAPRFDAIAALLEEIERSGEFARLPDTGTLVSFRRRRAADEPR